MIESSESPERGGTVGETAGRKATTDAEVELLDESRSDLILLGMGASEVMEVESFFKLSVEVTIPDEGN